MKTHKVCKNTYIYYYILNGIWLFPMTIANKLHKILEVVNKIYKKCKARIYMLPK